MTYNIIYNPNAYDEIKLISTKLYNKKLLLYNL